MRRPALAFASALALSIGLVEIGCGDNDSGLPVDGGTGGAGGGSKNDGPANDATGGAGGGAAGAGGGAAGAGGGAGGAGGAGGGGAMDGPGGKDGAPADAAPCTMPSMMCSKRCVDTRGDIDNCGACGKKCNDVQICAASKCECRPGLTATSAGGCVDTQSDPGNCGMPGVKCPSTQICKAGACVDASVGCGAGLTACDRSCANTQTDPTHCGDCGTRCDPDELCVGGNCTGYSAAPECMSCPCKTCPSDQPVCCTYGSASYVICVDKGEKCP